MSSLMKLIFQGGRTLITAQIVTLVNNTQLIVDVTIPVNRRYLLKSVKIVNPDDVVRTVNIDKYETAGAVRLIKAVNSFAAVPQNNVRQVPCFVAAGSELYDPSLEHGTELLTAGHTLRITWFAGGASAGGAIDNGLVINWLVIDV